MNRRDYVLLARVVGSQSVDWDGDKRMVDVDRLVVDLLAALQSDNDRFNSDKFVRAVEQHRQTAAAEREEAANA